MGFMKNRYLLLAASMVAASGISAQNLKGDVESYETVVYNVFLVKDNNGILNLSGDTVIDGPARSLTAVRLDSEGNPVQSVTYGSMFHGIGGVHGGFFSLSDTIRKISGRIDHETGGIMFSGNTVWTEALHFERRGFDYEIPWEEPLIWTDYKYQDGKLVQESTMDNSILSQGQTIIYEYNDDGTPKSRVLESKVTGHKEQTDYYCHNGRIDSIGMSYYNYLGTEIGMPPDLSVQGRARNGILFGVGADFTSDFKREKRYYEYNPDGSYRVMYLNDGTGKTEYYDSKDCLQKTVLPDGSFYECRYNSQGDPVLVSKIRKGQNEITGYDSYKYDSHGNWTRRRVFISDEDGFMIPEQVEYRRFCYRDGERYESSAFRDIQLKPRYIHVVTSPDNKTFEIHFQSFGMGEEMTEIDDELLKRLKQFPGFKSDGNGQYTFEGHPLIISKVIADD